MKNFIFTIAAVFSFLIGLIAVALAFIGLIDPEGVDKLLVSILFIITAISFLTGRIFWKLSGKEKNLP